MRFASGLSLAASSVGLLSASAAAPMPSSALASLNPEEYVRQASIHNTIIGVLVVSGVAVATAGLVLIFTSRNRVEVRSELGAPAQRPPPLPIVDAMARIPEAGAISSFLIDRREVTVDDYHACVAARVCGEPERGPFCNWNRPGHGHHPVNCVDLRQARDFCAFVGKRLPRRAEWMQAATLVWEGRGRFKDWGDDGVPGTWPAGSLQESGGIADMWGNLWEWTDEGTASGGGWDSAPPSRPDDMPENHPPHVARNPVLGFRCVS
jgi:hypothetical protein